MNNKIAGAVLLAVAGLMVVIGDVGSQIADAIVLGQFYSAKMGGYVPTGPENTSAHLTVIIAAVILGLIGLFLVLRKPGN